MNRRRELCRNFQRGSCQYGDRCKFLHATQQQTKPNPFGFGSQATSSFPNSSQQQKPNPFGFGMQSSSPLKGASTFGAGHDGPAKPFENKWVRPGSSTHQQTDTQSQATVHKCTDPDSCKRQIAEDFKNEAPLWKLTCYGHCKNGPCDIVGDISYEELRAAAYNDAKLGLPLQSIVERERNLLNSKLIEFNKLLQNPSTISKNYGITQTSNLFGAYNSVPSTVAKSDAPASFSSFSQLGQSTNFGSNTRTFSQGNMPNTVFGQPTGPQSINQTSGGFEMKFGTPGVFGNQLSVQASGSSPSPSTTNFHMQSPHFPSTINNPMPGNSDQAKLAAFAAHHQPAPLGEKQEVNSVDSSVWLKEAWAVGEIPEDEPPEMFC